jgi:hypothetical protein
MSARKNILLKSIKLDEYGRTNIKSDIDINFDISNLEYTTDTYCPPENPNSCTVKNPGCIVPPPKTECSCPPPKTECSCPPPKTKCNCSAPPEVLCKCPDLICPCPPSPEVPDVPDIICSWCKEE